MINLEGRLETIVFRNEATKYTVARLSTGEGKPITVVGFINRASPGQAMRLTGKWITHPRYGPQFEIAAAELTVPATIDGIRAYLGSGIVRGLGPSTINKIITHFGEKTLDMLNHEPQRLTEVNGIGDAKALMIADQWAAHCTVSEIMDLLQEYGIKGSYGPRIYSAYGNQSIEILRRTPYRLAEDLPSTGFYIADTIARKTGTAPSEPDRARACIEHILREGASSGHVFIFFEQVLRKMQTLFEIDADTAREAIRSLAEEERIIIETIPAFSGGESMQAVFSHVLYQAEKHISIRFAAMQQIIPDPPQVDMEQLTAMIEDRFALRLSSGQRQALIMALTCRVSVITGGPGTGKTTLIKAIATALTEMGKRVCLAAPTGRAARRISELTLRPAHTIHKLLGYNFESRSFEKNTDNPVDADMIIVDEASMIDTELMHHLTCATRLNAGLILVGDMFQLPSVGPGNIFSDIILSETIPISHLNRIFRQAGKSPIVTNAHLIREGRLFEPDIFEPGGKVPSEFFFVESDSPEKAAARIVSLCTETLPDTFGLDPATDIQVLTPVHKGEAGTINLNAMLQAALNPGGASIQGLHHRFKRGDRVMHVKNNYQKEVFNGDTGVIVEIEQAGQEVSVDFDGRIVSYVAEEIEELSLGYAITVHKAQGSEYPAIVMPLTTKHYVMLQRNLVYTAVTRAKQVVVMVGTRKALEVSLKNDKPQQRLTTLSRRLRHACGETILDDVI